MNVQHQVKQVGVPPIEVGRRLISAKNIIGQGALNIEEGRVVDEVVPVVIGRSVWVDNEILKRNLLGHCLIVPWRIKIELLFVSWVRKPTY
jgi:hypothetical protein